MAAVNRIMIELVEDQLMFSLDDLIAVSATAEHERVHSKERFLTRLTLKGRPADFLLATDYESVRDQIITALRVQSGADR